MDAIWIEKNPDVCGGDACIRHTRHTVHGLVEWKKLGLTDQRILEHHPDLSPADLQAAWEYYESHREEIDQAIAANHASATATLTVNSRHFTQSCV